MNQVHASIVLYHNKKKQLTKAINSFLNTNLKVKLYLMDNSSNDSLKELENLDNRIEYIFNNANLGYGKAHNIALKKSIEDGVPYHLVLNPDVYYEKGVLENIFNFMENNKDIGLILPKVLYPNGDIQYVQKLLPTPFDLLKRRFLPFNIKNNIKYELRFMDRNIIQNIPSLSGCFMFLRINSLKNIGLFDEKYFMYMEDIDLSRRIHQKYKTIYYPHVEIYHEYAKDSYKNFTLLKYHLKSAIYYFNKWGWLFDKKRSITNKETLRRLNFQKN